MVRLAIKKSVARQILWVLRKGGNYWKTQPRGQPGNAGQFASAGNAMTNRDNEAMTEKQPWGSSTEKAKELKISDFGTPEEVREIARMPRTAVSFREARSIMEGLVQKPIQSKSGLCATISKNSIDKILSGEAVKKSSNYGAHLLASVNVDILFSNAIEKWSFEANPEKNNQGLKERKYLYAPMEYSGRIIPVKLTIKQFTNSEKGTRIYSLEAIDVDIKK